MRKGAAGVWIIVLIIMILIGVAFFMLTSPDFVFGTRITFDDNVIEVSTIAVSDRSPFAGGETTLEVFLKNNGDETVRNIEFEIFDHPGFVLGELTCPAGPGNGRKCTFELLSLDEQRIIVPLTASGKVVRDTKVNLKYFIKYPMKGSRESQIPIIENTDLTPKGLVFNPGVPSVGPIKVVPEFLGGREKEQDGQKITEKFATPGSTFTLDFSFENAGVSKEKIKFGGDSGNTISFSTSRLNMGECDILDKLNNPEEEPQEVPFSISCNFVSSNPNILIYETGTVRTDYTYNYIFTGEEQFTIEVFK